MSNVTDLQEMLAHLARQVEDLSDVIARQDSEIDRLGQQVEMLMRREAERSADQGGAVALGDQKPPHW
ncbi:SlyX protein [Rhodobacteraceae bacterium W635]|uniref:SlyX family protein n=1 Tax=Nioella halotolerans TaxID=2303578 RepID=UPI000E3E7E91|nr:SlyX protein [Rhodobacteraceae bacterium W635]